MSHLLEGLQQVATRDGECDVHVVHDEQRLLLALVGEIRQVVRDEQQQINLRLLQQAGHRTLGQPTLRASTLHSDNLHEVS